MKIQNCLATRVQINYVDAALLLIRLIVGIAFMIHGWGMIQHPFDWMPAGAPVPPFFQLLAAISEFFGGAALALGLLARLGSLGIAITMLVAVATHAFALKDPFVNTGGGSSYELAAVYFSIALFFVLNGPGQFSLDRKIFGVRST